MSRRLGWAALALAGVAAAQEPGAEAPAQAPTPVVGMVLSEAPVIPPGGVMHLPVPSLDAGVQAHVAGDPRRAIFELERWLASDQGPWGRERDAGRFLLGWLYMHQDQPNLASAQFTRVRKGEGPLAVYAAWYEALTDHQRGRHEVAAKECEAYRAKYPTGPNAQECLVLMGDAWVAAGARKPAIDAYQAFLDLNPGTPREEEIRLGMALAEANASPERGARLLAEMVVKHDYHCNGAAAEEALDALLADAGIPRPELDPVLVRQLRAITLRECGFHDEAWETYRALADDYADDARVSAWVEANADSFAWRTRQYESIGDNLSARYELSPDANTAWLAFRAYFRGGVWARASDWGEKGLARHSSDRRWRGARDEVAHAAQLAGRYELARGHWAALAKGGGSVGRSARWFEAYAAVKAEQWADALTLLDARVASGDENAVAARYYRGKVHQEMGNDALARKDWRQILDEEPESWYALLLRSKWRKLDAEPDPELVRMGHWGGPPPPALPPDFARTEPRPPAPARPMARGVALPDARSFDWAALAWSPPLPVSPGQGATALPAPAPAPAEPPPPQRWLGDEPGSYAPGAFYDPVAAQQSFYRFSEANKDLWPLLPAIHDLARVGIYEISGFAMAEIYEEWVQAARRRTPRQAALRRVQLDKREWRLLFLFTRDHHHVARFAMGLEKVGGDAEQVRHALRLTYPEPEPLLVRHWCREYGVDPMLVYGLMRTESLYRSTAVSRVGAVGLMQIMPATGAKVAALLGEPAYSPIQLEDPSTNIRFGVYYLSKLLERFDGAWPLAVAAYNAGPVNVSSWYRGWEGRIGLDDWVEQIPLKETRNYVKKVAIYYGTYTLVYGPPDAVVHLPPRPAADRQEVINF